MAIKMPATRAGMDNFKIAPTHWLVSNYSLLDFSRWDVSAFLYRDIGNIFQNSRNNSSQSQKAISLSFCDG
jgi:hypothetical protein